MWPQVSFPSSGIPHVISSVCVKAWHSLLLLRQAPSPLMTSLMHIRVPTQGRFSFLSALSSFMQAPQKHTRWTGAQELACEQHLAPRLTSLSAALRTMPPGLGLRGLQTVLYCRRHSASHRQTHSAGLCPQQARAWRCLIMKGSGLAIWKLTGK